MGGKFLSNRAYGKIDDEMSTIYHNRSRGAASIFVVAFFMLLIGVIALSFVNIVVQDQRQALNNDLSQSAYDSATAGTEDGQRILKWYAKNCQLEQISMRAAQATPEAENTNKDCAQFAAGDACNIQKISSTNRDTILPGVNTVGDGSEVKITQTKDNATNQDDKFDQAYTCVTVTAQTNDYQAILKDGKSDTIIPLKTVNNTPVQSIDMSWFSPAHIGAEAVSIPDQDPGTIIKPLRVSNADGDDAKGQKWGKTTPPILRVEIIPSKRTGIDINAISNATRTVFLYPSKHASAVDQINVNSIDPAPLAKATAPIAVKCNEAAQDDEFTCSVSLAQLIYIDNDASQTDIFLRVTPIYNNTNTEIILRDATGGVIRFDNVAPKIDSTGRANDVYRRISTRVQTIMPNNPTSDGGFDITQGLCKDFQVPEYTSSCSQGAILNP
jgi:Tfp pilus assembly protein PilX